MSRLADVPLFAGAPVQPRPDSGARSQPTPVRPDRVEARSVDWRTVVLLRRAASEEIAAAVAARETEHDQPLGADDRRMLGRSVVRSIVRHHAEHLHENGRAMWSLELEGDYARAVEDAIFGYGRLQPLFEIPEAENIEITGFDHVMVQYGSGRRRPHPPVADSDEELVEAIRFLGESTRPPRPFDEVHPTMTLALGDRFRLHAIGFGLAHRPSITIRQHTLTDVTLDRLVASGMLPQDLADLLGASVRARMSLVIAGDQGAGKTTLLRALIAEIPETERFGTLETDYELLTHLRPNRGNVVALQARVGMGESVGGTRLGEVSVADLIPEALRQNLARIVVGEVRGAEAGAMFEAMQAGAGTLSTTHSHSASATMDRLASRVAQGHVLSVEEAYRQIAHNIGLIIHVELVDDTWRGGRRRRFVSEVRRVTGAVEQGRPVTHVVYRDDRSGSGGQFTPDAELLAELAPFERSRVAR